MYTHPYVVVGARNASADYRAAYAADGPEHASAEFLNHEGLGSLPGEINEPTMRAELIGHSKPCITEIYLYIDARMADYIRTHP